MKFKIAFIVVTSMFLSACAHTPVTQGDKMLAASDRAKELSQKWNEGNKLVVSGTAKQNSGNKLASQGESQIAKGEKLISEGESMSNNGKTDVVRGAQLKQESENNFDQKFPETEST